MKRAFSLTEVLIVISITLFVAAASYPILQSIKKSSNRNTCISNLRQFGKAILIYREAEAGLDKGSPIEMGLPPQLGAVHIPNMQKLHCAGNNPKENAYYANYPDFNMTEARQTQWARYVGLEGTASVLYFDPNHQNSFPRSVSWEQWTVMGIRLNGAITTRTRRGLPLFLSWWRDQ